MGPRPAVPVHLDGANSTTNLSLSASFPLSMAVPALFFVGAWVSIDYWGKRLLRGSFRWAVFFFTVWLIDAILSALRLPDLSKFRSKWKGAPSSVFIKEALSGCGVPQ
ncbi:hypothetical protein SDJN03_24752, partial [Cucurbita argyrosperma subsp. sororia]